jgi:hypothetical protein
MQHADGLQIGVFDTFGRADAAVADLLEAGVAHERISVVCREDAPTVDPDVEQIEPAGSHAVPAAITGGTIGTILGGLMGAVGVAATGGTGLLVAGPLLAGAAGMGVVGSFIGAMSSRGLEPDIADYYDQALARGQTLVAVEPPQSDASPTQATVASILFGSGAKTFDLRTP